LPRTYVALDLETTGLNPDKDAIIEVGAVKFRDGEIVEEFTTLVNPGRPIPPEITMITRITDRDVLSAPPAAVRHWVRGGLLAAARRAGRRKGFAPPIAGRRTGAPGKKADRKTVTRAFSTLNRPVCGLRIPGP